MRMTSLHGPFETIFGKNEPISASFGSILSLPISPPACASPDTRTMRAAISSDRIHFQRDLHPAHAGERVDQHRNGGSLGLLKQQRGTAGLHARSANSVISRTGSTSNGMRFSSFLLQSAR